MLKVRNLTRAFSLVAVVALALTACSKSDATPTKDPQMVYTEAAQTVAAGLTETALAMPSSTPTNTVEPTATATVTPEVTATSEATVAVVQPSATVALSNGDKAEWVTQSPADGTSMYPGQDFTLVWTLKNVGTTTWTTSYQVRYYLGGTVLRFGASDQKFSKEVKPGESIDLTLSMEAPQDGGDYTTQWVLTNKDGANFYPLSLNIKVTGNKPAPTNTPAPATNTPEPTATTEVTP
jgi:hypothetical protein